ncbi:helix-turn-helix domain-containing protein [Phenylobacterium sp.]|uniref:helix-turn-helix domain-containing protein n=1 Tax=Phenylobacterium sp. TaxID=1871053 RepID=UPI0025EBB4F1|nr:helix-turn-helix domain-containing protein [Phenylobacterium sp.]
MRYAEFPPPASLRKYVHCLWVFEGHDADEPQRIVPDGRCELILHWGAPYLERDGQAWTPQPRALFAGQLTRPLHLLAREPAGVVGVRFRTVGAAPFLQSHVNPFTDRRLPLAGAPDLRDVPDETQRLAAAAAYVAERLHDQFYDRRIASAAAELRGSEGRIPLDELAAKVELSPRMLQRRFLEAVGVPPRMLASVLRFRRLFEILQTEDVASWTDAAQAAGYFDHPQMARDFRRFLGCTPTEFLAAKPGLAVHLVEDDAIVQARAAPHG